MARLRGRVRIQCIHKHQAIVVSCSTTMNFLAIHQAIVLSFSKKACFLGPSTRIPLWPVGPYLSTIMERSVRVLVWVGMRPMCVQVWPAGLARTKWPRYSSGRPTPTSLVTPSVLVQGVQARLSQEHRGGWGFQQSQQQSRSGQRQPGFGQQSVLGITGSAEHRPRGCHQCLLAASRHAQVRREDTL